MRPQMAQVWWGDAWGSQKCNQLALKWSGGLCGGVGLLARSGAISPRSGCPRSPESGPMRANHLQHSSGLRGSCGDSRGHAGGTRRVNMGCCRIGRKYRWDSHLGRFRGCPLKNGRIRRAATLGIQRASGAEATGEVWGGVKGYEVRFMRWEV